MFRNKYASNVVITAELVVNTMQFVLPFACMANACGSIHRLQIHALSSASRGFISRNTCTGRLLTFLNCYSTSQSKFSRKQQVFLSFAPHFGAEVRQQVDCFILSLKVAAFMANSGADSKDSL
jgi:hypothetical protein